MNADYLIVMCALAIGLLAFFAGYGRGFRSNAAKLRKYIDANDAALDALHSQAVDLSVARGEARRYEYMYINERRQGIKLARDLAAIRENNSILGQRVSNADAFYHLVVDVIEGSSIDTYRQRYLKDVAARLCDGETLEVAKRNVGKKPKRNSKRGKYTVAELIANNPYGVRSRKKPRKVRDKTEDEGRWVWHQNTGECPYAKGTLVDVEYQDGSRQYGVPANEIQPTGHGGGQLRRLAISWRVGSFNSDIAFHRIAALPDLPPRFETAEEVKARKAAKERRREQRH